MKTMKLPVLQSPKLILSSNTALDGEGNTNRRRQFVVELGDFYVRKAAETDEPVRDYHKGMFFSNDWSAVEWNRFYSLMIGCVALYLKQGLIYPQRSNRNMNRLIQKTSQEFASFITSKCLKPNNRHDTAMMYEEFKAIYMPDDDAFKQRNFTDWLTAYADIHNLDLNITRSNGRGYFTLKSR